METYFDHFKKSLCCGCTCCEHVCPTGAINMKTDGEGFLFPIIDKSICIDCGLCRTKCPLASVKENIPHVIPPVTYALKNRDINILKDSSSGGAFSVLADYTLDQGGTVIGCAMDDEQNPVHRIVQSAEALGSLRGSKYVQSDLRDVFPKCKALLLEGKIVLFTGTPCQIAGLNAFLGDEYENLITVDLVCHGVPSSFLFHEYLKYLEKKNGGKIVSYRFRDKSKIGWGGDGSYVINKNGREITKYIMSETDYYISLFETAKTLRECCYECRYASYKRPGDFTIGDYWKIGVAHPGIYSKDGVSVFIVNSKKANKIFENIGQKVDSVLSSSEKASLGNRHLSRPPIRPVSRDSIYADVLEKGFEKAAKENYRPQYLLAVIRRKMPAGIKGKIKKILKR